MASTQSASRPNTKPTPKSPLKSHPPKHLASDNYPSPPSHARPIPPHLPPIGELPNLDDLPTDDDDLDLTDSELLDIDANPGSYFLEPIHDDTDLLDYSAGILPPSPLGPRSPEIREVTPSLVQQLPHHLALPKPPGIPKLAEVGKAVLAAERDIGARVAEERRQEQEEARERDAYQGHMRAWLAAAPLSLRDFQLASSPPKRHAKKFSKGKRREGGGRADGGDAGRVSFAAPGLSVGGGKRGCVRLVPTQGSEPEPERKRRASLRGRAWREPSPELGMIEEVDEDAEVVMRDLYGHSECEGLQITAAEYSGREDGFPAHVEANITHDAMDVDADIEDLPTPGLTTDTDAEGTPEPDELVELRDRERRPAVGPGEGKGKGKERVRKRVRFAPWTEWMGCD